MTHKVDIFVTFIITTAFVSALLILFWLTFLGGALQQNKSKKELKKLKKERDNFAQSAIYYYDQISLKDKKINNLEQDVSSLREKDFIRTKKLYDEIDNLRIKIKTLQKGA